MILVRRRFADRSPTFIGGMCTIGASVAFTINDMSIKSLSGGYPLHEVILIRSLVALAIVLGVIMPLTGGFGQVRTKQIRRHLIRGCFVVFSNIVFFSALASMPLADATAIFFVAPLIIAAFSVIFLGEVVGPWRWGAIGVGLVGAIFVIQPGSDSFTAIALLPLLAATAYAGPQTMTRLMGPGEKATTMAFYIQVTFLTFSLLFGLIFGSGWMDTSDNPSISFLMRRWIWPDPSDIVFFLGAGLGTAFGGWLISQAYRLCQAAIIAPLEYVAMPMAILWGIVIFGDFPNSLTWIGIFLILGAGIFLIIRETRLSRR